MTLPNSIAETVIVHSCDETSLKGAVEAAQLGTIIPTLVRPSGKINAVAREYKLDISDFQLIDVPHSEAAAARGVELIHESRGELLMKGRLHTGIEACLDIEEQHGILLVHHCLELARRVSHHRLKMLGSAVAQDGRGPRVRKCRKATATSKGCRRGRKCRTMG